MGEARCFEILYPAWDWGILVHAWQITPQVNVLGSRDLFKFREVTDNMLDLKTVQDRDMVAMDD